MSYAGNGIWYEIQFFQNVSLIILANFNNYQFFVKTKSQDLERHLNCKISDKRQNYVSKLRHTVKSRI